MSERIGPVDPKDVAQSLWQINPSRPLGYYGEIPRPTSSMTGLARLGLAASIIAAGYLGFVNRQAIAQSFIDMIDNAGEAQNKFSTGFYEQYPPRYDLMMAFDKTTSLDSDQKIQDQLKLSKTRKYLKDYLKDDLGALFSQTAQKTWTIFLSKRPIHSIHIDDHRGIILTDFPDRIASREMLTGGPGTGPNIKSWNWGQNIEGVWDTVVVEDDQVTAEQNIWLVSFTNFGGWPRHGQPHLEAARVYASNLPSGQEKTRASFKDQNGQPISLAEIIFDPRASAVVRAVSR